MRSKSDEIDRKIADLPREVAALESTRLLAEFALELELMIEKREKQMLSNANAGCYGAAAHDNALNAGLRAAGRKLRSVCSGRQSACALQDLFDFIR